MKTYRMRRVDGDAAARITFSETGLSRRLAPRLDLANHSPTGFEWGYNGSGPAQLALALLADALNHDERALRLYQRFKFVIVATRPRNAEWQVTDEGLRAWADANDAGGLVSTEAERLLGLR